MPTHASGFEVVRSYKFAPSFSQQDENCLHALEKSIKPQFDGLFKVQVYSPSIVKGYPKRNTLALYSGIIFESEFGSASGALVCVFRGDSQEVLTISVNFDGRGLAGFKKHPLAKVLNDPSKQRATGYSQEVSN